MTTKTALIGHPVSHSKSPLIHGHWIAKHGLNATYEAIDLPCEDLEEGVQTLIREGYKGFNITVPHKVDIMSLCDQIDDLARIVGAVNTVTIENGKLSGTNTDVYGFTQNIRETAPDFDFTKGPALVLGAGGAARAIIQGLIAQGVPEIRLSNRTKEKALELLENASTPEKIKLLNWDARSEKSTQQDLNLLVNTTSLGMTGKTPLEIDLTHLPPAAHVNDIVYAPLMTDLLTKAKANGNPIITGIGMLLHQARPGFKLWHGIMPEVTEDLREKVLS
ncbi:MAG: shikimate dehydrogenase [Alphaproteobacteria bacterium]|nr:shikimate dehydrogenase [Alphaproteobacteria bacterium]